MSNLRDGYFFAGGIIILLVLMILSAAFLSYGETRYKAALKKYESISEVIIDEK